jgi:ABC-type transport system involved in multi-copper enzyme maturation permease subunit
VIVFALVVLVQPLLALVESVGIAQMGVDATPQTNPDLLEPLAPVPYTGFDILPFGAVAVIVLGAVLGAAEYRHRELRTTLLAINNRSRVIAGKLLAFTATVAAMSLASVYATIAVAQAGLGDQGINPLVLSGGTWRVIGTSVANWTALGLCAYGLALAARTWLVPLLVLAPQVMGLGEWLVSRWEPGRFLPVSAGTCVSATPDVACSTGTALMGAVLAAWVVVLAAAAWVMFSRRDVGA